MYIIPKDYLYGQSNRLHKILMHLKLAAQRTKSMGRRHQNGSIKLVLSQILNVFIFASASLT